MVIDPTFIDLLDVPASVHGVDGCFLHVNAAAELVSGHSVAEFRGRHYLDMVTPANRTIVRAQFERALGGDPTEFETTFTDASGRVRGVRAQHLPLKRGGDVVAVLILAFDVTVPPPPVPLELPVLTRRQNEILQLVAGGKSTEEIAAELTLSHETVRNYLRGLMQALDAHSRVEAVATARRLGLLASPPLRPPE